MAATILNGEDVLKTPIRLERIVTSGGQALTLNQNDVLVVVGPNNAGKSQFLRDIEALLRRTRGRDYEGKVAVEIGLTDFSHAGLVQEFESLQEVDTDTIRSFAVSTHRNNVTNLANNLAKVPNAVGELSSFVLTLVSAENRLSVVQPSPALQDRAETPGQLLYDSEKLLGKVSDIFFEAFHRQLFLDYRAGGKIPIYVGEKPQVPKGKDRLSDEYVEAVRKCDKLHEQGDGMRSFGGIILSTMVVSYNITLIDEPEAFLHPPQERAIGRAIGENVRHQVVCSTHSKSVLQGFLESDRNNIRVVRLTRDDAVNDASEIEPEEVKQLWADPVFRYSTALEALFHEQAVVCEADADCKFFEALKATINLPKNIDTHFVPCGGKAAFPKFIRALRKLSIPVIAILDLDALNNESCIANIYKAQGGDWNDIKALWRRVDLAIREGVVPPTMEEAKVAIKTLLEDWKDGNPPIGPINETLKSTKPWSKVKAMGVKAVPSGDAHRDFGELLEALARFRIFPIPEGEIEGFVREEGGHGTKWLNSVFEKYDLESDQLRGAREFLQSVFA